MYRVLIADDEQFVIRGLKRRIDWKKLGCEVVGSAEDGDEAFRLACELRPDIIITDIKMPGRSGLQLIQGLKGIVPAVFIIYSAYTEFEYARKALGFETVDYLVKPINIAQIENAIKVAKERVDRLKYNPSKQDYHNLSTNSQIYRLLEEDEMTSEELSMFSSFAVLCIKACKKERAGKSISELADLLAKEESENKKILIIRHLENLNIVCCSVNRDGIYDLLHKLGSVMQMQQALNARWFFYGVGEICFDQRELSVSFRQANDMLNYSFFVQEQVVNPTKFSFKCSSEYREMIENIVDHLFKGDEEVLLEESVNHLFERMLYEHLNVEAVQSVVCKLVYNCRYIAEHDYGRVFEWKLSEILNVTHVVRCKTINELKNWSLEIIEEIRMILRQKSDQSVSDVIRAIYAYIENHINSQITLTDLADFFNMNASYISHLFKKETGMNLFDYITSREIECAKKLLNDDRLLIGQIAKMVGYEDQRYFCHVFKKNVGMTAQNFRDKQKILQIKNKNL